MSIPAFLGIWSSTNTDRNAKIQVGVAQKSLSGTNTANSDENICFSGIEATKINLPTTWTQLTTSRWWKKLQMIIRIHPTVRSILFQKFHIDILLRLGHNKRNHYQSYITLHSLTTLYILFILGYCCVLWMSIFVLWRGHLKSTIPRADRSWLCSRLYYWQNNQSQVTTTPKDFLRNGSLLPVLLLHLYLSFNCCLICFFICIWL